MPRATDWAARAPVISAASPPRCRHARAPRAARRRVPHARPSARSRELRTTLGAPWRRAARRGLPREPARMKNDRITLGRLAREAVTTMTRRARSRRRGPGGTKENARARRTECRRQNKQARRQRSSTGSTPVSLSRVASLRTVAQAAIPHDARHPSRNASYPTCDVRRGMIEHGLLSPPFASRVARSHYAPALLLTAAATGCARQPIVMEPEPGARARSGAVAAAAPSPHG